MAQADGAPVRTQGERALSHQLQWRLLVCQKQVVELPAVDRLRRVDELVGASAEEHRRCAQRALLGALEHRLPLLGRADGLSSRLWGKTWS